MDYTSGFGEAALTRPVTVEGVWRSCARCEVEWRDTVPTCWCCAGEGLVERLDSTGHVVGGLRRAVRAASP